MKKITSLYLLIFCSLCFSIGSCKKDSTKENTDSEYYAKFKMNGNWITLKSGLAELGPDLDDNTKTNFSFVSNNPDGNQMFGISFQVDGSAISQGTYSSDDYYMPIDYTTGSGNNMKWYSMQTNQPPYSSYTITLSAITNTTIKGNFTGNFLVNDLDENDKISITEGEFFLKRIR